MEYTPGPWKIEGVAIISDDDTIALCTSTTANARLIAAAPELLEALRDLQTVLNDCGARIANQHPEISGFLHDAAKDIAGTAITKATQ